MAKEGMKLTSFYATPVCSVSRAQMMTGCYGARVSVPGVYFPGQTVGLNPSEVTVAERLKEKGYATQIIGKWHLGDQPEFLPTRQGFDHYLGIPYSNDMLKKSADTKIPVVPLLRDEKIVELMDGDAQTRLVEIYTKEAVDFIGRNKDQPFYLYFAHNAVHTPIHPGAAFAGKSQNGRFGDWVEEVDWSVGQVLDALRSQGLEKDTLVVFTSDNGPWLTKGNDGGSAGVWRGIGPVVEVDRYPQGAALGRAGLTRLPAERRLGPTEFPCVLEGPDGERGMVHFEHHIFGA
jgi:arylsulfatase A-like enzyme